MNFSMIHEMVSMLAALLYYGLVYGLTNCLLVAGLGALVKYNNSRTIFFRIMTWAMLGTAIAAGGYSLLLFFIVFIVEDPAYQGQGLGIALADPIILRQLVRLLGASLDLFC
jgi:MFS-type transporter involved in bile tolerance (Atg22 family)